MQTSFRGWVLALLALVALALPCSPGHAATLDLSNGWNLVSSRVPITVAETFADSDSLISVWKWQSGQWAVYLPAEAIPGSYAGSKGFASLTTIEPGAGFWVNAKVAGPVAWTGEEAQATTLPLATGWNLKGLLTPDPVPVTPLFAPPVPVTSVWKWQAGAWAVALPGEAAAGAYATSKGFSLLTTIESGAGFWVNAAAAVDIPLATPAVANQAQALGPLAGAEVAVHDLNDLANPIATSIADDQGRFPAVVSGGAMDRFLVVRVSGGKDVDANADGVVDALATDNAGTFSALLTACEYLAGDFKVSLLTELAWRYTKNMVADFSPEAIALRLDDVAKVLIAQDIDGDTVISRRDLLAFNPQLAGHQAKLNFAYQMLLTADENGDAVITALHANQEETLVALLEQKFGTMLSLYPVADSRTEKVKVEVTGFGKGSFKSAQGAIDFDSDPASGKQVAADFFALDPATTLTILATPKADTKILGWSGCDTVADDLSQCQVSLAESRHPVVTFGYSQVEVAPSLVDLTNAEVTLGPDTVQVTAVVGDTALLATLAALDGSSYVVGATDGGFLRKVVSVQKVDAYHYTLTTTEASLEEVVKQGTGTLNMEMTNEDLAVAPATPLAKMAPGSSLNATGAFIPAVDGVTLLAPANPKSKKFKLRIGQPGGASLPGLAKETKTIGNGSEPVILFSGSGGAEIKASGEVELTTAFDVGASYGLFSGLEYFKFIPSVNATESLAVTATGTLKGKWQKKLGTLQFTPLSFFIGVVPVWITPRVEIYIGADAKVSGTLTSSITFNQGLRAGIVYSKASKPPWSSVREFTFSSNFVPPTLDLTGEVMTYLQPVPSMLLYGQIGPQIPINGYVKASAEANATTGDWKSSCAGSINCALKLGLSGEFSWDAGALADSKLGAFVNLDQLMAMASFSLFDKEWLVKQWQVGGECPPPALPPHLEVTGFGNAAVVAYQSGEVVSSQFQVSNSGDEPLLWSIGYQGGSALTVSPDKGLLVPGQSVTVTATVASGQLGLATYARTLKFVNTTLAGQQLPDTATGNTSRQVSVTVTPAMLAAPLLTGINPFTPTAIQLIWSYGTTIPEQVKGYRLYHSVNGGEWTLAATITNPQALSWVVGNLQTGANHAFSVEAYGDALQSAASNALAYDLAVVSPPPLVPTSPLNDTGITWYGSLLENFLATAPLGFAGQDADYGRDAAAAAGTLVKAGGGTGGFDFTKLDASGKALPASAAAWSCVRDNHTGLTWEVKSSDGGLRDQGWEYTWYNSDPANNGGNVGDLGDLFWEECGGTLAYCNTEAYTAAVNSQGLCGAKDWRLPNPQELQSIVDYGRTAPSIDTDYFPDSGSLSYCSSSSYAGPTSVWSVEFYNGNFDTYNKNSLFAVRLVRGGQ